MRLSDLIKGLPLQVVRGRSDVALEDIADDSRRVTGCSLFVARTGVGRSGKDYIDEAIRRGAVAVVTDTPPPPEDCGDPVIWVTGRKIDQALTGRLAERFFNHPSSKLKLVGITGTNGKTTTALLLAHILREARLTCGVIGTVFIDDGQSRTASLLTTPGPIELSRHFARFVANGCDAAVVEVSSHALAQGRTRALEFDVGVFTNLTGDHLDYHRTTEAYVAAKARLFAQLSEDAFAVLNTSDRYADDMVRGCCATLVRCQLDASADRHRALWSASLTAQGPGHSDAVFAAPWGNVSLRVAMPGRHNVTNALLAAASAHCITDVSAHLRGALESCPPVPGRLEAVGENRSADPLVFVDYAHTHDALKNVLAALRPCTRGKLIVLFGCGGDRDRSKRPKMAKVACRLADEIIITSDNPRTEDPDAIIDEILTGVPELTKVRVEPDRGAAIRLAVSMADRDDVVLLAGKGHEQYQEIGTTRLPFDDREQAAAAMRR